MSLETAISDDFLLGGRVRLRQPATGYRAGLDAVLLAAAVDPANGLNCLELGTGSGAAALCLLARCAAVTVTGLENDSVMIALARANISLNARGTALNLVEHDLTTARLGSFDQVFANPPFHDSAQHGAGIAASHMPIAGLRQWIDSGARQLKSGGVITLIHRADALPALLPLLEARQIGAIKVKPIQPREGVKAKRILISGIKARKTPLELLSPLIVHNENNTYTDLCEAILREAAALPL